MRALLASLLVAVTLSLSSHTMSSGPSQGVTAAEHIEVIEVTAKKYEFNPLPIRVKQGTKVQLRINAADHAHGFRISLFPEGMETSNGPGLVFASSRDCVKIEKGQMVTVEFVAQSPGTYPFRCCVHCGWSHRSMKGTLIVEP